MTKIRPSKCCPVCKAWFYPATWQQRYDSPRCKRIGVSINAAKRRQEAKKRVTP